MHDKLCQLTSPSWISNSQITPIGIKTKVPTLFYSLHFTANDWTASWHQTLYQGQCYHYDWYAMIIQVFITIYYHSSKKQKKNCNLSNQIFNSAYFIALGLGKNLGTCAAHWCSLGMQSIGKASDPWAQGFSDTLSFKVCLHCPCIFTH